jgi:predicted nucleotidyltransferase
MRETIDAKHADIAKLCAKHRVIRLSLFGSALNSRFTPGKSDVDFLVEFVEMSPSEHAPHYFGLQEDLESLLGAPVDLVELAPIRNPFFKQDVESKKVLLFEAA